MSVDHSADETVFFAFFCLLIVGADLFNYNFLKIIIYMLCTL